MPRKSSEVNIKEIISLCSVPDEKEVDPRSILGPFLRIAKWIPRGFSPYLEYDHIIYAGLYDCDPNADERDIRAHQKHREIFEALNDMNSKFYTVIEALQAEDDDGDSLNRFIAKMNHHMREARAQDTNMLKYRILTYLPFDPETDIIKPAIVKREKSVRGWAHIWTARALCPIADLAQFDANPQLYMKKVQNGTIKQKYSGLPSFLFEQGTVYNPNNKHNGLFRGHVLIRSLRMIYTGESSAFTGHRDGGRPSQAELNNIREVTPFMVAYGACQAYVSLSSMEKWCSLDNYFDLDKFHKAIVKILTTDHQWATETLEYLTSQLPSLKRRLKRRREISSDESDPDDSDADPTGVLASLAEGRSDAGEDELSFEAVPAQPEEPNALATPPATNMNRPLQHSPTRDQSVSLNDEGLEDEEETIPIPPQQLRGTGTRGRGARGRGRGGTRGANKPKGRK